jgi:hypothetical protein
MKKKVLGGLTNEPARIEGCRADKRSTPQEATSQDVINSRGEADLSSIQSEVGWMATKGRSHEPRIQ